MARVRLYNMLVKATGLNEYETKAKSVDDLLEDLLKQYGSQVSPLLKGCQILINGRNIGYLSGPKTRLKKDDEVSIFPLIVGG